MKIILACAALLTVSQGRAQTSGSFPSFPSLGEFRAEMPQPALTTIDELLEILRDPVRQDPRVVLSALDQIGDWTRVMTPEQEARVIFALEGAADSASLFPQARAKALDALSKTAVRARNESTYSRAVEAIVRIAGADNPQDSRRDLRLPALLALARTAPQLPEFDRSLTQRVMGVAFGVLDQGYDRQENLAAMRIVRAYLHGHGAQGLFRDPELARRAEYALISPYERDLMRVYGDFNRGPEFRYELVRSLAAVAWTRAVDGGNLPHRARGVLSQMAQNETDPTVKRLACIYSRDASCRGFSPF